MKNKEAHIAPGNFNGEIANRQNIGKTSDELVAQWNAACVSRAGGVSCCQRWRNLLYYAGDAQEQGLGI